MYVHIQNGAVYLLTLFDVAIWIHIAALLSKTA